MASLFKTFNYTGALALSSYTLPFTNFYFKPEFNQEGARSNSRVLWDFGDGTTLYNDINPVHYYPEPGIYTLRAIVSEGQCSKIFESQITVENINGIQAINKLQYRPTSNFYSIDGKLVKKL